MKFYQLSEDLRKVIIIKDRNNPIEVFHTYVAFLQSIVAHLKVIANITQEEVNRLITQVEENKVEDEGSLNLSRHQIPSFSFSFLSKDEMSIWNKKYQEFLSEVEKELRTTHEESQKRKKSPYVVFSGAIPILRN